MKTKLIKVTQRDIDKGTRASQNSCPIARAICRTFKKNKYAIDVSVRSSFIKVYGSCHYGIPKICQDFILNFDIGRKVEPFEFELNMQ
jgi:hypothetical protein